jgi:hypothetical protein
MQGLVRGGDVLRTEIAARATGSRKDANPFGRVVNRQTGSDVRTFDAMSDRASPVFSTSGQVGRIQS